MVTQPITRLNDTLLIRMVCSILFCCFTFVYLYVYQADVLAVTQHVLSGGRTSYHAGVGAVLITLTLYLVHLGVSYVCHPSGIGHSLTFFPSLLLLTILTDVSNDIDRNFSLGWWWIAAPLLLLASGGLMWFLKRNRHEVEEGKAHEGLVHLLWQNIMALGVMFVLVGLFSNHDVVFHERAKIEQAIVNEEYKDALEVGKNNLKTDSNLVMLRAYCLSKTHKMGESLFEYPLIGESLSLLPNGSSVRMLMTPDKDVYRYIGVVPKQQMPVMRYLELITASRKAKNPAKDYLLCGYLLDKNLDKFVAHLPLYYHVDSLLPKHYREALVLYTHSRSNPKLVYHDAVADADYKDYQDLEKKYPEKMVRETKIRDIYGKTYWYYFHYHQK
ncbi:DUF6057 family protein [Hoylesella buccalis]|uniref:DUF6057 family protein n=1 Tax=Hoylesella buccalis TaxID=28127 RepID=UPI0039949ECE